MNRSLTSGCALLLFVFASTCRPSTHSENVDEHTEATWQIIGFGGGGATFDPVVSPHDPGTALLSCDMTGSYLTTDGGGSWKMFNLRGGAQQYVFDPVNPEIYYAVMRGTSAGVFRTTNAGADWEQCYPHPDSVKALIARGDHAEERQLTPDSVTRAIVTLSIDPDKPERLYAVQRVGDTYRFTTSDDRGTHWRAEHKLDSRPQAIYIDPGSPQEDRTIYVAGHNGITIRKGGNWTAGVPPSGVAKLTAFSAGYDREKNRMVIYAIAGRSYFDPTGNKSGIFITFDGLTWENRDAGMLHYRAADQSEAAPEWRAIAASAQHPEVVYLSFNDLRINSDTTSLGVARSDDFGKSWKLVWEDKTFRNGYVISPGLDGGWIDERYGPTWGENPFSIGVSPSDPNVAYATDFGRVMKTIDGSIFTQVYTRKGGNGGWASRGIDVTSSYGVVFDPFDDNHLFMANTDVGMMESFDRGIHWVASSVDRFIPDPWNNTTYAVAFDPSVKGRAWAAFSGTHDLPRPKMWRTKPVSSYTGGIAQTDDGGKTWQAITSDIGEGAVTHVLIDPTSDVRSRTLYASVFGKGVYKSGDGGRSWKFSSSGLPKKEPFAWRMFRRDSDGHLFLVIARRSEDGSIGTPLDGALYRSVDEAETWTRVNLPEGTNGPMCLITDAGAPGRLLLSAWGRPSRNPWAPDTGGGIFLSEDDGASWRVVLPDDQHVHDITYDLRSRTFYACGFTAAAWQSADGLSWEKIPGYDFKWGRRVDPDPKDPDRIYISTFGGGVWNGSRHGQRPRSTMTPTFPVY